jgi:tetratricopeptide (TPR) repeat protein/serine/threonine protein kinase
MPAEFHRVKELFLAALEKGQTAERAAYLESACGADIELRKQVDALLARHAAAGSFLEAAPIGLGATADSAPPNHAEPETSAAAPAECPGTVIGPYKLLEQIGEGGMGTVWMAQQTEPVKRLVAVKLIKAGMDSRQVIARFEAERQALALMDHANIARVLDAGTTSAGRPYFVMDLVKGVPITKYCDDHRLTPRQRLELFIPVCAAVQHAHQKGIIHRDLKPSNVLVALYDGRPVPKVIDFGVAKATVQTLTEKTLVTGFGNIVGTLEYMSPEQAETNQLDIDTRSDIYSLGVLLYELLTGSPPFTKKDLEKAGILEMLRLIREQEPSKPSTKLSTAEGLPTLAANRGTEPAKLTKLVRGELDWIVMKALEKDRNRRYETASAFAADVQRHLNDEPVLACPPSAWYRFRKFGRRHKGRLVVAACVLLAGTVMAGSIGWALRDRAARQASVAVEVRDSLSAARALIAENKLSAGRQKLAEARAQLGNSHSSLANLALEIDAAEADIDCFQQFLELIDQAHQAETAPILEGTLRPDGFHERVSVQPTARMWDRRPAAAVPFLVEALQRYAVLERDDWNSTLEVGLLGRDQVEQIRRTAYEELLWLADDVLGRQAEHRSRGGLSAQSAAQQALVYLRKAQIAHSPTQAFYLLRARCHKVLEEEAASLADKQLADKTHPTMALDHYLQGQAAYDAKKLAEGVEAFEAALHLEPTHYWSMMRLGYCLCDLGQGRKDFAGAARVFTGCLLKRPDHAHAYYCRSNAYRNLGELDKALADLNQAIELAPKSALAWYGRGVVLGRLGRPREALADFSNAIGLDPGNAQAWYSRGVAYNALHQYEKSLADFSKAIELDPHPDALTARGNAYSSLKQIDKALADLSRAIELDPKSGLAWASRGNVYQSLGRPDEALADSNHAIEQDQKNPWGWISRGNVYRLLGQADKSLADFSKAIDLEPKNAQAWSNRGTAYLDLGQPAKAFAEFTKAIELDPELAPAWSNRGNASLHLGQPAKALDDFSKAIELDPKFAKAWGGRGTAFGQLGQPAKAVTDISKAIEFDSKFAPAWRNRGSAYLLLGRHAEAIADFSQAIELSPKYAAAHDRLAWLLATCSDPKLRDPHRAVAEANEALALEPKNGIYWQTFAWAQYRAGDCQASVTAMEKVKELGSAGDSIEWFLLALAHWKLGNKDEARQWYGRAVAWMEENQPKNEELARFRAEAGELLEIKKN